MVESPENIDEALRGDCADLKRRSASASAFFFYVSPTLAVK
jgi:hypothetical protein